MSVYQPAQPPAPQRMLSILRIVAGAVFMEYGTMKLFDYPPAPVPGFPVHLATLLGLAGLLETFGGLLILIGLFTRPVAFILAGEMAVAYFKGHFPKSFFPAVSIGTPAVLFCFIYLYFVAAGGGAWSVDAMIAKSKAKAKAVSGTP